MEAHEFRAHATPQRRALIVHQWIDDNGLDVNDGDVLDLIRRLEKAGE